MPNCSTDFTSMRDAIFVPLLFLGSTLYLSLPSDPKKILLCIHNLSLCVAQELQNAMLAAAWGGKLTNCELCQEKKLCIILYSY